VTLENGEKLGPYEILGQLGKGAMGVVYRARDTRLGRDVAVKVLAASIAGDLESARRFEVEARAAGVLSHPNIVAIHDIGQHPGGPYLVSELLEGETLRDILRPGKPLAPRKAVEYGLQIAQGLAAAHEKGIVHRDLKPENLFVTRDGRVKILDFGLARLVEPVGGPAHSESTIRALQLGGQTQPGTVLGTVGYMAPEQVRGQPADHRSDLFAFGAILYEALAGRKTFQGASGVDVLSAILSEEPPPLANVLPALERVVRRCLRKAPEERFQSARDLAFQLETLSGAAPTVATTALPPQRRRFPPWAFALAAALAVLVSAGAFFLGRRLSRRPPAAYHQLTFRRGNVSSARFAPDGKSVVYAGSWQGAPQQLFQADPKSPESRPLELPEGDLLSVSGRGEMAMLLHPHLLDGERAGTLARAALSGGTARELLLEVEAADFAPDGEALAVARRAGGRTRLEYPPGKALYETDGAIADLRVSRDGKSVAFIERPLRGDEAGLVALVDPKGVRRALTAIWPQAHGVAWSASGSEIWFTASETGAGSALRAVTRSGSQRLVARVTGRLTLHDIAPSGQVLLVRESARAGLLVRRAGDSAERDLAWFDGSMLSDLADDGAAVLFVESGSDAAEHAIYLRGADGSPAVRLGDGVQGRLAPDAKRVLVIPADGPPRLLVMPIGAGDSLALPLGDLIPSWAGWFADGKRILVEGRQPGHGNRLYIRGLDAPGLQPVGPEGMALAPAAVSPDGALVAALDPEGKLAIFPVNGDAPRALAGLAQGTVPIRFSEDGRSVYAFRPGERPARVVRASLGGPVEPLFELSPSDPAGVTGVASVRLTRDGRGLAYGYRRVLSDLYLVDGLE
jgi:eukaryotic-like serine/threonine-protein kinase